MLVCLVFFQTSQLQLHLSTSIFLVAWWNIQVLFCKFSREVMLFLDSTGFLQDFLRRTQFLFRVLQNVDVTVVALEASRVQVSDRIFMVLVLLWTRTLELLTWTQLSLDFCLDLDLVLAQTQLPGLILALDSN